ATPRGVVYQGREPGQTFTPTGAATAFAGPIAALALILALIWPTAWLGPSLPTVLFLVLLALLVAVFAWLIARHDKPADQRLLGYAWEKLVPTLNAPGAGLGDSGLVAGLARLTSRLERADVSPELLNAQLQALSAANAPPAHLAAVCRLIAEVAAARG